MSESQTQAQLWIRDASQDRQPEILNPGKGRFSKDYGADQQRLQHSARISKRWEKRWLTGDVGMSTAY